MTGRPLAVAARGVAALTMTAALTLAVPAALWRFTGPPLTPPVGGFGMGPQQMSDDALIWALAQVCWLAWTLFIACLAAEAIAAARQCVTPALPAPDPMRRLAAELIASIVLLGTLAPASNRTSAAPAVAPVLASATTTQSQSQPERQATVAQPAPLARHVVQPREDLWSIAEARLGDPYRWRQIWDLNAKQVMADGSVFTDPDHIRPGWTLQLPIPAPPDQTDIAALVTQEPSAPSAANCDTATPADTPTGDADADDARQDDDDTPLVPLPGGGLVTLSFAAGVAAALAAARLHQRRRYIPGTTAHGPDPAAPDSATLATTPPMQTLVRAAYATAHPDGESEGVDTETRLLRDHACALTGDNTDDVARALAVGLLVEHPGRATVLVAGAPTHRRLFPRVMACPDLETCPTVDDALSRLEVELIRRTRTLEDAGISDYDTLRVQHPEEPMNLLALIADADPAASSRLHAITQVGARLGIRALVLGRDNTLPQVDIAPTGQAVTDDAHLAAALDGALPRLRADEAEQIIRTLAASCGTPAKIDPEPSGTADAPTQHHVQPPVHVRLFGPLRITNGERELDEGLRKKALEFLAYLLLHPEGVSSDAALETLWPDADPQRSARHLRTIVSHLRTTFRQASGVDADFIRLRSTGHFHAEPELIDCDYWQHQRALRQAAQADTEAAVHLRQAVDLYTADLLEGHYYDWAEPLREAARRSALDAAARLARMQERAGQLDAATTTLETAIRIDPYAEDLYRRLMRLHATAGRTQAVRHTYRRLESRLAEIDAEPDDATVALRSDLR